MKRDQTTDYVTAFVVGTIVGVGAALLFAPEPPTRREKLMKELKPYGKKLRKQTSRARKSVGRQAAAASDWSEEMVEAGRAVVSDIREEVAGMVADARKEIASTVETQLESAQDALRRGRKRIQS